MTQHLIELSTQIVEPKTFTVDDIEYKLLGLAHLSKDQEARLTAKFALQVQLAQKLIETTSEQTQVRIAHQLRETRIHIFGLLTDMPREVADSLSPPAQIALLEVIGYELGLGEEQFTEPRSPARVAAASA